MYKVLGGSKIPSVPVDSNSMIVTGTADECVYLDNGNESVVLSGLNKPVVYFPNLSIERMDGVGVCLLHIPDERTRFHRWYVPDKKKSYAVSVNGKLFVVFDELQYTKLDNEDFGQLDKNDVIRIVMASTTHNKARTILDKIADAETDKYNDWASDSWLNKED